ncbi:MAG: hypothetical protein KBG48_02660 [Kofleriaceae bacterium]|nr:hypothetical protein [Kofleriaceae bacterium]MBP9166253.1 hypothetical protein [Kofleriaceae bacterium]MBP9859060.1 hypothetical protein [Kofleriaceae bacterium]
MPATLRLILAAILASAGTMAPAVAATAAAPASSWRSDCALAAAGAMVVTGGELRAALDAPVVALTAGTAAPVAPPSVAAVGRPWALCTSTSTARVLASAPKTSPPSA